MKSVLVNIRTNATRRTNSIPGPENIEAMMMVRKAKDPKRLVWWFVVYRGNCKRKVKVFERKLTDRQWTRFELRDENGKFVHSYRGM